MEKQTTCTVLAHFKSSKQKSSRLFFATVCQLIALLVELIVFICCASVFFLRKREKKTKIKRKAHTSALVCVLSFDSFDR